MPKSFGRLLELIERSGHVLYFAVIRFWQNSGFSRAAGLAYTTLFALVPLTALSIIMYTAVGVDEQSVDKTVERVLDYVLPISSDGSAEVEVRNEQLEQLRNQVTSNLISLGTNARTLGIVSTAVLFFIAIGLLNTIESALNAVWQVSSGLDSLWSRIVSFWAVITGAPLFIALSIYLSTKAELLSLTEETLGYNYVELGNTLLAISVSTSALWLMFTALPACKVRARDALFGAFVSACLFELLKRGFAYYLTMSSSYSTIYGVLATIPLFLFWLYLAWVVILLGAEVSFQAGSIRVLSNTRVYATRIGSLGALLGFRILLEISNAFLKNNQLPGEMELATKIGIDPQYLRQALDLLSRAGILSSSDQEKHVRVLMKTPESITLRDVILAFRRNPNNDSAAFDELEEADLPRLFSTKTDCGETDVLDRSIASFVS